MISRLVILAVSLALSATADTAQPPSCFDQSIDAEQLRKDVSKNSLKSFDSLEPGMARETVLGLVGAPTYLCGSGIAYDVYVLGDGREVWIAYSDGNSAWAFVSDIEGSEKSFLFGGNDKN